MISKAGSQRPARPGTRATAEPKTQTIESRQRRAHALAESELRYRRLFEATQDGILILDANTGLIEDVNPYLLHMLGYSREEFLKKKIWEVGAFKDIEASKDAFEALQQNEYIRYENLPLQAKDGRQFQVEFISNVYMVGGEKVIQCDIRDVTEHKRIIAALLSNEKKYRDLVNESPDGMFIIELPGRIVTVNKAMCRELGFTEEELLTMHIWDIIPEQYLQPYKERLTRILEGKSLGEAAEYAVHGKDQALHYVQVLSAPYYKGKDVIGFYGIAHDLTQSKRADEALRLNEEKYRNLIEKINDGVYVTDAAGVYTFANSALARIYGAAGPEELLGRKFAELGANPRHAGVTEAYDGAMQAGNVPEVINGQIERPDGTLAFIEIKPALIDKAGKFIGSQGIVRDITDRKRAEASLRESENRLRVLFSGMTDAVIVYDRDGRYLEIAPTQNVSLWRPASELLGKTVNDLFPPDKAQFFLDQIRQALKTGQLVNAEYSLRFEEQDRWFSAVISPLSSDSVIWVAHDFTSLKQGEQRVRESEERFRTIIDQAPFAIALLDRQGHPILSNRRLSEMVGYSSDELSKMEFIDFTYPEDADEDLRLFTEMLAGKIAGYSLEKRFIHKNGNLVWGNLSVTMLRDANGLPQDIIGMAEDITERKQSQILQQAVYRIAEAAENTSSLDDLYARIHQIISSVMPAENFYITTYDAARDLLLFPYFKDVEDADFVGGVKPGTGLTAYVLRTGKSLLCTQAVHDELERRGEVKLLGVPSAIWLGVPLIVEGTTIGAMVVQHYTDPQAYGEREQHILEFVSRQVAIAIKGKQAEEELESRAVEVSRLYELSRALADADDLHQVLEVVNHHAVNNIHVSFSRIALLDGDELVTRDAYPIRVLGHDLLVGDHRPITDLPHCLRALQNHEAVLLHGSDPEIGATERAALLLDLTQALYLLPLHVGHAAPGSQQDLGLLMLSEARGEEREPFTAEKMRLAQSIGDQAATAIRRKQAETTLRESEMRYQDLARISPVGIFRTDRNGVTVYVNPTWCLISGLSADEAVGDGWLEVVHPEDRQRVAEGWRAATQNVQVSYSDYRFIRPDGTMVWVMGQAVPEMNSENEVVGYVGTVTDITARKQSEEKVQRQLEHLTALSAIDRVISSNFDLKFSLSEILTHVTKELGVDAADILVLNSASQVLEFGAERGFRTPAIRNAKVRLGANYAGRIAVDRQDLQIPNLGNEPDPLLLTTLLKGEDFVYYYGLPLIAKGQVHGVLEVLNRAAVAPDLEWIDFLHALAAQAAIAIENSMLFENFQRSNLELTMAYDATIEGWSRALDLRDKETEGHTQRVTEMTLRLARSFGLSEAELMQVRWGGLLHDIGKMGVPDGILLKPGPLTDEEWLVMRKHPDFAHAMLSPIGYLRRALDIPYCHHEKWDGSGYPRGLKGDQIPLVARIFAVVDVWDALSSDRPYRAAWVKERVREHIRAEAGTHFDPQVVEAFLEMID